MHTLKVIAAGLVLLSIFLLAGRYAGGSPARVAKAALLFVPVWLLASTVNLWIGVSTAGYTVMQELPILLVVFGVPALVATAFWWKSSRSSGS